MFDLFYKNNNNELNDILNNFTTNMDISYDEYDDFISNIDNNIEENYNTILRSYLDEWKALYLKHEHKSIILNAMILNAKMDMYQSIKCNEYIEELKDYYATDENDKICSSNFSYNNNEKLLSKNQAIFILKRLDIFFDKK